MPSALLASPMVLGLLVAAVVLLILLSSPKKPSPAAHPAPAAPIPFPGWNQPAAPPAPLKTNRQAELEEDAELVRSYFYEEGLNEQRAAALARLDRYRGIGSASAARVRPATATPTA